MHTKCSPECAFCSCGRSDVLCEFAEAKEVGRLKLIAKTQVIPRSVDNKARAKKKAAKKAKKRNRK